MTALALVVTIIRSAAFVATPWLLVPWVITWNHEWVGRAFASFVVFLVASALMMWMIRREERKCSANKSHDRSITLRENQ
ncbi:putative membrane protein YdbT with pleckstrin-like domain [Prescottella agglutinans]|uniref:Membrane protein YdbT with pleckstrin-like domain n=1 Tax=Prescottella agglutinans TaxID=1644129 RepID=A0ABT6MEW6_9NOCA|nr:putative membrane protein YdbT with pleckstrin-like domain [Prescottella agglutinans]